jgi:hypothetical protein
MLLQEILRDTKHRKQQRVVLKLDFEKAYDKVNWNFLLDCCKQKGVSEKWLTWINKVVSGGTLSVKINDCIGFYFCSYKGVRQGDPFAPTLFNLVVNRSSKMIQTAQRNGLISGLADQIIDGGCAILQYADDTILFMKDDVESARNLKLLLYIFESMSGLKINFEKSEVLLIQPNDEKLQMYVDLFNCQIGSWPIKYLGTPVCARRITVSEMKFVEEKLKKGMEGRMSGSMSLGGRVTKIDACLSNSAVYQMSLRLLHKTNIEGMEKPIRAFLWASTRGKRRYHLVSWKLVCTPKSKDGLGIKNLCRFNISLMCKWWWKLEHDSGPWQDFMWKKYLTRSCVFLPNTSPLDLHCGLIC